MDYAQLTLDELRAGFQLDGEKNAYRCHYCGQAFKVGQVFPVSEQFFDAEHAIARHIEAVHDGNLAQLLHSDSKYNTLTDIQRQLFSLFHSGLTDAEIAKKLDISASTVRHQKFTFREKAKQAKLYLAIFEETFADKPKSDEDIVPIHNQATYYDDRYVITEQEKAHILEAAFECLDPPVLKNFPVKEKKKVVVLTKIVEQFERGRQYTEKEINQILKPIFDDFVVIRRYLIMYGFMERASDGSGYWLTQ